MYPDQQQPGPPPGPAAPYGAPQPPADTPGYGPNPEPNGGPSVYPVKNPPKSKRKLIIIVASALAALVIIVIIVVVVAGGKKPSTPAKPAQDPNENSQSQGPQPATSLGVEQINNSISQDISGLNDDQDYPPTKLDDKTLTL